MIKSGKRAVGKRVPEGRFKELLRSILLTYDNSRLLPKYFIRRLLRDPLDTLVTGVEMKEEGLLAVELSNGLKLFAQQDRQPYITIDIYSPRKYRRHILPKREDIGAFRTLWHVLREIYVDNVYQKHYEVKQGDIVIDAGANIGAFTVQAAKAVGNGGMVVAIEPDQDNVRSLERNVRANGLRNVIIIQKGIWSRRDRLKLFIKDQIGNHTLLQDKNDDEFVEVEVDTIDNIIESTGLKRIDFVKIDIEGAEIEALRGMEKTLMDDNVSLAMEACHEVGGKPTHEVIAPWLKEIGFQVHVRDGVLYGMKIRAH